MKFLDSQLAYFLQSKNTRRNIRFLVRFILLLVFLITFYSIIFHYIMELEGRHYSWTTGFYWTLTVMSTLGFGDITFASDLGKVFSIIVLSSGVIFLLVLLPFTFIQFFYAPWIEAERKSRAPRELHHNTKGHVIITDHNQITIALMDKLKDHKIEYVLIVEDIQKALELYDQGYKTALGNIDDPATYIKMRVEHASLLVAAGSDEMNTNIAFTVKEVNDSIPIIATADSMDSVDILTMAGATRVLQVADMLGRSLTRRVISGGSRTNLIGRFGELIIAEAPALKTPLIGKTITQSRLRELAGVSVVGVWDRGKFEIPGPDTVITTATVLVLAGSEEQINNYEEMMCIYQISSEPVIIIGSGRVGSSAAKALEERGTDYIIVEKNQSKAYKERNAVIGSAADLATMKKAGIDTTPAVIVTTHDDATNIYLTKYCRSLRPDIQIISRANAERNVSTLHRAGADFVMSFAALGANTIFNFFQSSNIVMLAEGLDIFNLSVPAGLYGKTLAQSKIRQETGCTVVATKHQGKTIVNPDPNLPLQSNNEIILIGTNDAEKKFLKKYSG